MTKHNQVGAVNGLAISLTLSVLLLLGAIGFGAWAFIGRQDYKDNVDTKIQAAQEVAKEQESAAKDRQFAEESKKPLKLYQGPEEYGSLELSFPKTWSAYIDESGTSGTLVNGYFAPGFVPSTSGQKRSLFALRVQIVSQPYAEVLQNLSGRQGGDKPLTISAYALPKLPKVVGIKAVGNLDDDTNATMVVLPMRSQTLQVWTEGSQYLDDFNNSILPNLSFSP